VTIEAKDNDVLAGAKWGRSEAITILPPDVGAPEAARFQGLVVARSALVDALAFSLENAVRPTQEQKKEAERLRFVAVGELRSAAVGTFAGARAGAGLEAFLLGQARRLEKPAPGPAALATLEDVLLAVDAALRSLARRDAQTVAKRLGDAAEEVADGFQLAGDAAQLRAGTERARVALRVLDTGAKNLTVLDVLGADLGSVTQGELRRIRRAEAARSLLHAELAARHLAARLRRPTPSFGSAGGGGAGVEAGEHGGSSEPSEPASQADQKFDEVAQELAELTREHGALIEQVNRDLEDARGAAATDELRREAAERAAALRQAIEPLPRSNAREGTGRAASALAREHAAAMAERMERLELELAKESGRTARGLSEEAQRKAQNPQSAADFADPEALDTASRELEKQLAWTEQMLERMRGDATQRSRDKLREAAERESSIERRMGELTQRAERSEAALPEQAMQRLAEARRAMKEAASELGNARGEPGLALQREAQRLLEQGNSGRTTDSDAREESEERTAERDGQGKGMQTKADVPGKGRDKAAAFRRRVLEGLGKERGGRLDPAVRRYAEGLLE
jgi:hypothetical protein